MKYANYDENTKEFLGWYYEPEVEYDTDGNALPTQEIPTPNIQIDDTLWNEYINMDIHPNMVDVDNSVLVYVDPRTPQKIREDEQKIFLDDYNIYIDDIFNTNGFVSNEDVMFYTTIKSDKKILAQTLMLYKLNTTTQIKRYFNTQESDNNPVGTFEQYRSNLADFDSNNTPTDEFTVAVPTYSVDGTTLTITLP